MFKKFLCFALTLIVICSGSLTAFADMEGPYFEEFEYTVDNPDGIQMYETEWIESTDKLITKKLCIIPDGTVLTITGDYTENGETYLYTTYGDNYGFIKTSDVQLNSKDVVKPTNEDRVDYKQRVIVINPDGASLRSGPSGAHPEVATVPAGTEFELEYVIGKHGAWAYVTHNGKSGWLHFYQYTEGYDCVNVEETPGKVMVVDDSTYLTKTPDRNSPKVSEAIPYGTVLEYKHVYNEPKSRIVYVEYNGVKGWVPTRDAFTEGTAQFEKSFWIALDPDGVNIYADAKQSDEILCKIPYNTVVPAEYCIWNDYAEENEPHLYEYVSYNGTKGWLRIDANTNVCRVDAEVPTDTHSAFEEIMLNSAFAPVYSKQSVVSSVLYTLKNGDIVYKLAGEYVMDDDWYLVYNGECLGWVSSDNDWEVIDNFEKNPLPACTLKIGEPIPVAEPEFKEGYDNALPAPSLVFDEAAEKADETTQANDEAPSVAPDEVAEPQTTDKSISPQMIAVLCIAAAIIGAATAAVIIVIVIKKKKKKN